MNKAQQFKQSIRELLENDRGGFTILIITTPPAVVKRRLCAAPEKG